MPSAVPSAAALLEAPAASALPAMAAPHAGGAAASTTPLRSRDGGCAGGGGCTVAPSGVPLSSIAPSPSAAGASGSRSGLSRSGTAAVEPYRGIRNSYCTGHSSQAYLPRAGCSCIVYIDFLFSLTVTPVTVRGSEL